MGQHSLSMKVAVEKNIKLIVGGDTYAERAVGGSFKIQKMVINIKIFCPQMITKIYFLRCSLKI